MRTSPPVPTPFFAFNGGHIGRRFIHPSMLAGQYFLKLIPLCEIARELTGMTSAGKFRM